MARTNNRGTPTRADRRSICLSATAARLAATTHPHDARDAASRTAVEPSAPTRAGWIRSSYRLLMMRGLSPTEAGNVVAYAAGLHAGERGWSVKQIEQLVALRSLVECGVIDRHAPRA